MTALPGITARRAESFGRLGILSIEDLMRLAPHRYEDRRHPTPVTALEAGCQALVIGAVVRSKVFRTRRRLSILEAVVADETGEVTARWFQQGFLPRALPEGRRVALFGAPTKRGTALELVSPALERLEEDGGAHPGAERLVPVHPATTGLTPPVIRRAVWSALAIDAPFPDPVPPGIIAALGLPALDMALRVLHFPTQAADAEAARRRLAFDELLLHELVVERRRVQLRKERAWRCHFTTAVHARVRGRLPFVLTAGQEQAVAEIVADLERPTPMNRLLQGDVGSGKTAVAVYAALGAIASGLQVVFMAPTEVLARQHGRTLEGLLGGSRVAVGLRTGSRRSKERAALDERITTGEVDLVIGTHAVLSDQVRFARLGLVIVDEQHKFGVRQRNLLVDKGREDASRPHLLVMTATPIPRTLALTLYGDLDVSVITGRPPGRKPVETVVARPKAGRSVFARVRAAVERGEQAYVIYPLVEESTELPLKDAVRSSERWAASLPDRRVGLLHGRMKPNEKETVMAAFRDHEIDVLVSTVVVEVGVDVPNATVLVVEHAERFGLSQLHQLRGRIGRGDAGGLCVLMDRSKKGTPARLDVLAKSDDGFVIAEEDLKLRGVGDLFGTRQHGRSPFHAARLPRDLALLIEARRAARKMTADDRALSGLDERLREAVLRRETLLEDAS